jgi:choice-of-anchor A domain-containing protein
MASMHRSSARRGTLAGRLAVAGAVSCCLAGSAGAAGVASAAPSSSPLQPLSCASLGGVWAYGVFSTGNATVSNTGSELPEAIEGNASFSNFSVNTAAGSASTAPALAVGGRLSATDGSADGRVYVGEPPVSGHNFSYTTPRLTVDPVNFSGDASVLVAMSASLAGHATTPGVSVTSRRRAGRLTLIGSPTAALDVFNLTGTTADAELAAARTIRIVGTAPGATVVVNTDVASFNGAHHLRSTQSGNTPAPTNVVWNFADATRLNFTYSGWYGTILAPQTTKVTAKHDDFQGSLLVGGNVGSAASRWSGAIEDDPFAGCLPASGPVPATPQGAPLALGGLALLVVGGAVLVGRRRRSVVA